MSEPRKLTTTQRCHFPECDRKRKAGWTTCSRHKTAGISIRRWNLRQKKAA